LHGTVVKANNWGEEESPIATKFISVAAVAKATSKLLFSYRMRIRPSGRKSEDAPQPAAGHLPSPRKMEFVVVC
jgi:hypothetical protein